MSKECFDKVRAAAGRDISDKEMQELFHDMESQATMRAAKGGTFDQALKDVAGELIAGAGAEKARVQRNFLLDMSARKRMREYAARFKTPGEGLRAFGEGSPKKVEGARYSVDYQARGLYQKSFGRLVDMLEREDLLRDFLRGDLEHEIFLEMGELGHEDGMSGVSGSPKAMKIAKILEDVTQDMVSQQNRAGADIRRLPGYIVRQTHDTEAIRAAGGGGNNKASKEASFRAWSEFVLPLLDPERTFLGQDPAKFLRNVHEGLYSSVHGEVTGEAEVIPTNIATNFYGRGSKRRVLHFKDADSAFRYNQEFGTKSLRDAIIGDIFFRSRNIALLENFGPSGEANLGKVIRELGETARTKDNAADLVDSLNDWRIKAMFDTVSGRNDIPKSFAFSKAMNTVKAAQTLSKMGSTLLSAITDKGFFQTEMAFQGISGMQTLAKQITLFAGTSPEKKQMLHLMGVGLEGLIGSTVNRYTMHTSVAGVAHKMQQKLFDINFMNLWTDAHKGAAAELMAAHLGEHSHLPFEELPADLKNVLNLYEITGSTWDALRSTAWTSSESGAKYLTADKLSQIPDETIDSILRQQDRATSSANRSRLRDGLESKLRTYIADRVDIAVPSPGAAEKKFLTMGTQAGTPLGEAVRLLTMFKSFPLAVMNKVIARDIYGNGADSIGQWLMHDHKGKFRIMQTVAIVTALGYVSGAIRDALKGRTPKELVTDGNVNWNVFHDAMLRGGGLGIFGDTLFADYDDSRKSFANIMAGPIVGGMGNHMAQIFSETRSGEFDKALAHTGKLARDTTPFINLFYTRPVLDYLFLWNLQEMMDPGSLARMETSVEKRNHQSFFMSPSQVTR